MKVTVRGRPSLFCFLPPSLQGLVRGQISVRDYLPYVLTQGLWLLQFVIIFQLLDVGTVTVRG